MVEMDEIKNTTVNSKYSSLPAYAPANVCVITYLRITGQIIAINSLTNQTCDR
jgi:hypothetical protein